MLHILSVVDRAFIVLIDSRGNGISAARPSLVFPQSFTFKVMKWYVFRDFILTLSILKVCTCTNFAEHLVDEIHESKIVDNMIHNSVSETPDLNEEEMYSDHMPLGLMCDGCLAVAYQVGNVIAAIMLEP